MGKSIDTPPHFVISSSFPRLFTLFCGLTEDLKAVVEDTTRCSLPLSLALSLPPQPPAFSRLHPRRARRAPWWATHPRASPSTTSWATPCSTRHSPSPASSRTPSSRSWRSTTPGRSSTSCVWTWCVRSTNCGHFELQPSDSRNTRNKKISCSY